MDDCGRYGWDIFRTGAGGFTKCSIKISAVSENLMAKTTKIKCTTLSYSWMYTTSMFIGLSFCSLKQHQLHIGSLKMHFMSLKMYNTENIHTINIKKINYKMPHIMKTAFKMVLSSIQYNSMHLIQYKNQRYFVVLTGVKLGVDFLWH